MFTKISKIDLLNKVNTLENKIDIILSSINNNTFIGCCDCKKKECHIYNELKYYIEEQKNFVKEDNINNLDKLDAIFSNYKKDLVDTLETIISTYNTFNKSTDIDTVLKSINNSVISLSSKIDSVFYENEVIKHQLLLEDEIRKYEDEISNLKTQVKHILDDINQIL